MGTRRRYSGCLYTVQNNSATWEPLSVWGNKGISENNGTTIKDNGKTGWGSKENNGAIAMGMPSAYVAQWENLQGWYDIGKEQR